MNGSLTAKLTDNALEAARDLGMDRSITAERSFPTRAALEAWVEVLNERTEAGTFYASRPNPNHNENGVDRYVKFRR